MVIKDAMEDGTTILGTILLLIKLLIIALSHIKQLLVVAQLICIQPIQELQQIQAQQIKPQLLQIMKLNSKLL